MSTAVFCSPCDNPGQSRNRAITLFHERLGNTGKRVWGPGLTYWSGVETENLACVFVRDDQSVGQTGSVVRFVIDFYWATDSC